MVPHAYPLCSVYRHRIANAPPNTSALMASEFVVFLISVGGINFLLLFLLVWSYHYHYGSKSAPVHRHQIPQFLSLLPVETNVHNEYCRHHYYHFSVPSCDQPSPPLNLLWSEVWSVVKQGRPLFNFCVVPRTLSNTPRYVFLFWILIVLHRNKFRHNVL